MYQLFLYKMICSLVYKPARCTRIVSVKEKRTVCVRGWILGDINYSFLYNLNSFLLFDIKVSTLVVWMFFWRIRRVSTNVQDKTIPTKSACSFSFATYLINTTTKIYTHRRNKRQTKFSKWKTSKQTNKMTKVSKVSISTAYTINKGTFTHKRGMCLYNSCIHLCIHN